MRCRGQGAIIVLGEIAGGFGCWSSGESRFLREAAFSIAPIPALERRSKIIGVESHEAPLALGGHPVAAGQSAADVTGNAATGLFVVRKPLPLLTKRFLHAVNPLVP